MCKKDILNYEFKELLTMINEQNLNIFDNLNHILIIRYKELKRQQELF